MPRLDPVTRFHGAAPRVSMWMKEAAAANSIWARFALNWMAFNALYDVFEGKGERRRVLMSALIYFDDESAAKLLAAHAADLRALTNPPPGDDKKSPAPEDEYRKWGNRHRDVIYTDARPTLRLAHVFATIYQVRCNLIHGNKATYVQRDRDLVFAGDSILSEALDAMVGGRTFNHRANTDEIADWYNNLA